MSGLDVSGVSVSRGGRTVLDGVSLAVAGSEVLALLGPSGAGKTTLLRALARLEPLDGGDVSLDGDVVPRRAGVIGFVFQDLALWPHVGAARQVQWVAEAAGRSAADAAVVLRECGAAAFGERRPAELSGGERRRVALARALAGGARLLLLDEPFSGLDVPLALDLAELVRARARSWGIPVVAAVHAPYEAEALADRFAVLEGGTLSPLAPSLGALAAPEGSWLDRCLRKR